ncbi:MULTISPECIES: YoaK family protein [Enterococcus]|uniref:YoaK family protein n=1 Tax=Enterococcus TaxID=1350 RepID=UPI000A3534B1|nr:YoaK family protein [Enterococcus sp. OL5]OTO96423.1 hypothetical protein A5852_002390 [Enterococcus faecium]TPR56198.1 DUF1275 domain-containing protein [Enterococcus sp. OL5]
MEKSLSSVKGKTEFVVHESLPVGVLLAMAGGFLDAYTYLFHGEVFASMQSGNVILLGINLSTGQFEQAFRYLPPICMFLVGIVVTNYLQHHFPTGGWIVWQNAALIFEAVGILVLGFFARSLPNVLVDSGLSFFAAIQYAAYRRLAGMPYATTMTTGNLRSLADYLYLRGFKQDRSVTPKIISISLIIGGFFFGAVLSSLLGIFLFHRTIWVVSGILALVLGITIHSQNKE